jgi:hypothetical protein
MIEYLQHGLPFYCSGSLSGGRALVRAVHRQTSKQLQTLNCILGYLFEACVTPANTTHLGVGSEIA